MFRQFVPDTRHLWPLIISMILAIATLLPTDQSSTARPLVTEVSGTIEEDTTWTQANSPYLMTGDVFVAAGIHLTIEPGVIVKGDTSTNLTLGSEARLTAIGTEREPIIFTSAQDDEHGGDTNGDGQVSLPSAGQWSGVDCQSWRNPDVVMNIHYALFRYGTLGVTTCGDLVLQNSTVEEMSQSAIKIVHSTDVSSTVTINNNVIQDFALHAVLVPNITDLSGLNLAITDNTIVGKKHTSNYAGISVSDIQKGTIQGNTITMLGGNGIYVNESNDGLLIEQNVLTQDENSALTYVGIYVDESTPLLVKNQVSNFEMAVQVNDGYPQMVPSYRGNVFENNRYQAIGVSGQLSGGTWTEFVDLPHIIVNRTTIADGESLTIPAGTVIKLLDASESTYNTNGGLYAGPGAKLIAQGTEAEPIILTSTRDDEYGGDTNNNGAASLPTHGDWEAIGGRAGSSLQLGHVIIRYGYQISAQGDLDIQHSTIFQMSNAAISLSPSDQNAPTISIADNKIQYATSTTTSYNAIYINEQPGSLSIQNNEIIGYRGLYLSDVSAAQITDNTIDLLDRNGQGVYGKNLGAEVVFRNNTITRDSSQSYQSQGFELIDSKPQLINNSVSGFVMAVGINGGYPNIVPTYTDNQFENNQYNAVGVWGTVREATWTNLGGHDHFVAYNLAVADGATFTIPAGMVLKFATLTRATLSLGTGSTLVAVGTEAEPIILTSIVDDAYGGDTNNDGQASVPGRGDWNGLSSSAASTIRLEHVVLRYGNGIRVNGNLNMQNSTLEENNNGVSIQPAANTTPDILIENSRFLKNYFYGVEAQGQPRSLTIQKNTFQDNRSRQIDLNGVTEAQILDNKITLSNDSSANGIDLEDVGEAVHIARNTMTRDSSEGYSAIGIYNVNAAPLLTENQISGFSRAVVINNGYPQVVPTYVTNQFDGNEYKTVGVQGTIMEGTWSNFTYGHDHFINSSATVADGATLVIPAGTILKFASNASLSLGTGSSLIVEGTADQPIVLTSVQDDEYGTDANGDGQASQPSRGNWSYIRGSTASSIKMQHAIVRYGNGIQTSGNLTIQDSLLEENSYSGAITVTPDEDNAPDVVIENSTFRNTYGHGIKVQGQPLTLLIQGNLFEENQSTLPSISLINVDTGQISENTLRRAGRNSSHSIYLENVGSKVAIEKNTLEQDSSQGYSFNGIGVESKDSLALLAENKISGFKAATGISGGYPTLLPTYADNTFVENQYNGVAVWGEIQGGIWAKIGDHEPFINGVTTLNNDETLTISPGAIIKMTSNASLKFSSGADLMAVGTEDEPIIFTSIQDDAYGGDTNNDGDDSSPTNCSWASITNPNEASTLQLQHVIIRYSCNGVHAVGTVSILDSTFEQNRYGLYFEPLSGTTSDFVVQRNVIHDNNTGIYTRYLRDNNFMIQQNSIANNNIGFQNADSNGTVDVTENWWGAASGPSHSESNPDATGNSVSDNVNYDSWLTGPPDFVPAATATPTDTGGPTAVVTLAETPTLPVTATPVPTEVETVVSILTSLPPTSPPTVAPTAVDTVLPTISPTLPPPTPTEGSGQELPTLTPTPVPDAYEDDNRCSQAKSIVIDEMLQVHTFHLPGDVDWVQFNGVKDRTYRIEVQTQANSLADVNLEVYPNCDSDIAQSFDASFTSGVRLDQTAPVDGPIFLRLENYDSDIAGNDVGYSLSVRDISPDGETQGALIIMAGRLKENDRLQPNIHNVTDRVYRLFKDNGYSDGDIYYLATDDDLDGYDDQATAENLRYALVEWAARKVSSNQPLTLYMMDHGDIDTFYIDEPEGERLNPEELDGWLAELEGKVEGLKSNIIIEACNSGSFIEGFQRISRANRLVISSTNVENVAYASNQGAQFSDRFLMSLREGYGIQSSFWDARNSIRRHPNYLFQQPWIDTNGDGIPDDDQNNNNARQHNPGVDRLPADTWAPYIVRVIGPETIIDKSGVVQAEVRDNKEVKRVWASVYSPSYTSPTNSRELVPENVPTFELSRETGDIFAGTYADFGEQGTYNVTIYAEDNDGLKARLSVLEVNTILPNNPSGTVKEITHHYLPIIMR